MKIESKISDLGTNIGILHRQMTEQMSFEVDVKNHQKLEKSVFFKVHFFAANALCNSIFFAHMKI